MQPTIPVFNGDILRVQVGCYYSNQSAINTFYVVCGTSAGNPTTQLVADGFDTIMAPLYKAVMTNTATYYGVRVQRMLPGPLTVGVVAHQAIGVGTAGTNALPAQISGVVTLLTSLAGQGERGRLYIPFPDEADNPTGTNAPSTTYRDSIQLIGDAVVLDRTFTSGANSVALETVIFHRDSGLFTYTAGSEARYKWGTQRRRGSYGALNTYPPF